jgi:hypothetical protein
MRIDIEEVEDLLYRISEINKLQFTEIEWYKYGEPVKIDRNIIKNFLFTGLLNTDFIEAQYYKS